jgi:hypothetical protein
VVKLLGMVNAAPDFGGHPTLINGRTDLFVAVLGDSGRHAYSVGGHVLTVDGHHFRNRSHSS